MEISSCRFYPGINGDLKHFDKNRDCHLVEQPVCTRFKREGKTKKKFMLKNFLTEKVKLVYLNSSNYSQFHLVPHRVKCKESIEKAPLSSCHEVYRKSSDPATARTCSTFGQKFQVNYSRNDGVNWPKVRRKVVNRRRFVRKKNKSFNGKCQRRKVCEFLMKKRT